MATDSATSSSDETSLLLPKSSSRLDIIKYNVHTPFQSMPVEKMSKIAAALAIPSHLMLYNLDGNMNIAMSIRSASVLGISDVWIIGRRKYDARPEVGAKNYIRVHKLPSLDDPAAFFRDLGVQPILVEQGGMPLEDYSFKPHIRASRPVCFIMGSESHGIPPAVLSALIDEPRITISQYGLVRSLNVSIAASIILYEYLKQWRSLQTHGV